MNRKILKALAQSADTPMYVFDIGRLQKRIEYLKNHIPAGVHLCYAIKANQFILKEMTAWTDRLEVCSPGEGAICEALDLPQEKLVISGVYKTPSYMEHLVRDCRKIGRYTIESIQQFRLLQKLARKYAVKLQVLLRLSSGNQFGLSEEDIRKIISESQKELEICGLQYFSGTQKRSLKKIQREINGLEQLTEKLQTELGFQVRELEYGPGLPVCYFQDDTYDEEAFLKGFSQILSNMKEGPDLTLELGRSIAADCGTYLTRVVDTKEIGGQNYAITDGGIHHLVYYGQSLAMRIPFYETVPERDKRGECWNIFGSLCTINDVLVKQLPVNGLSVGDVIAFHNTGAYCMTEGISLFLSRDLPAVFLLKNETLIPVRGAVPTAPLNTPVYQKKGNM